MSRQQSITKEMNQMTDTKPTAVQYAATLVDAAHRICPYSKATRGNIGARD